MISVTPHTFPGRPNEYGFEGFAPEMAQKAHAEADQTIEKTPFVRNGDAVNILMGAAKRSNFNTRSEYPLVVTSEVVQEARTTAEQTEDTPFEKDIKEAVNAILSAAEKQVKLEKEVTEAVDTVLVIAQGTQQKLYQAGGHPSFFATKTCAAEAREVQAQKASVLEEVKTNFSL